MLRIQVVTVAILLVASGCASRDDSLARGQNARGRSVSALAREVTVCQLSQAPRTWDGMAVRVTGVADYAFENFTLSDPGCPAEGPGRVAVWLTYGGRESPQTIYCCPGEGAQSRRDEPLVIDGVALPIEDSEMFRRLRGRFQTLFRAGGADLANGATARVTFIGTFFAGGDRKTTPNGDTVLTGFGHFACCSLLVIQRVEQFEEMRRLQNAILGT